MENEEKHASKGIIVWFRRDLRLTDNPALHEAVERGLPIICTYLWAPEEEKPWQPGGATKWWLHYSLESLQKSLGSHHHKLIIRKTDSSQKALEKLLDETGFDAVYWNRLYDPKIRERDTQIKEALKNSGIEARSFNGSLLYEPHQIETKAGDPFKVFTPFWKECQKQEKLPLPLDEPTPMHKPEKFPDGLGLSDLKLLPKIRWDEGLEDAWTPGESAAMEQLDSFIGERVKSYKSKRDLPAVVGTSRLSPHLHFGEISPRQIYHAVQNRTGGEGARKFLAEVGWREFAHHLLYHFPKTPDTPLRPEFEDFPVQYSEEYITAWQKGQTGYPIVDAGMRELWHTGWMHNRVRMIVASFLVKHLLQTWEEGARWFWDTLADADLANNTLGWQWSAGCGADAQPYFRIFNPMLQSEKFDSKGEYVRRWVPEIADLPTKHLHKPWEAPDDVLEEAGVKLGETYPKPLVDHFKSRDRALAAFEKIKKPSKKN
jgi:deoxyribodipyrimidine photo-lyase